ncbi:citron Rho-interacting kinase-like isoform X2 [Dermacentor albipictus]|uniref:citron Rho-interacting kinase-like isoform X2 n=1 Tax=Dermacentor albipictus TaxID=60249 RepID=UPI0031FBA7B5
MAQAGGGNGKSPSREPIALRSTKLNHLVLGRASCSLPNRHLASRDSLLDALFSLYDECNREVLRRDKNISLFLDKYRAIVQDLRQLRVSIADFEVKTVIGRGHFGDIRMVKEKATGDIYAMKILRKDDTLCQREVAFFEEERDILARAAQTGPWLTRLQYAFQDAGHLYLVMELLPGGDLFNLIDRSGGLLPEEEARFYLAELTLAIHALHSLGYAHRDIKPDNVLIDRTGHIKLADFGSAAKLSDKKSISSRLPVGTPHYVAPEVLSSISGGLNACATVQGPAVDWWSLGVLAYEMLYGFNPFADDRLAVTYNRIMNFHKTLDYVKDPPLSEVTIKVLQGLLTTADKRFSYDDMCRHEFFAPVDLDNIRQTVPPFVPNLTGEEDTSNFYEFEDEPARAKIPALRDQKRGFEGTSLPFVGFTHTQSASNAALERTVSFLEVGSPMRETLSSGASLRRRSQRQEQLLSEVTQREESLRQEAREARTRLDQAQTRLAALESSLVDAEAREAQLRSDNQNLNMLVELERKNRLISEEKAVQLLNAMKRKYRRQDELLRSGYFVASPVRRPTPRTFVVDEANGDGGKAEEEEEGDEASVQSELQLAHREKRHLEQELAKERALCAQYKMQLNSALSEGVHCMEEMQKKHKANVDSIDEVRKEVAEAVSKQQQAEEALSVCRDDCSRHQATVDTLEKEVAFLKGQVSASIDKTAAASTTAAACARCAASLAEVKRLSEENAKLHREATELRSQHQRLLVAWESQRRQDSQLQSDANGLHSVVARLEGVVSTVEASCTESATASPQQVLVKQAEELEALRKKTSTLEEVNARYMQEIEKLNAEVQELTKKPEISAPANAEVNGVKTATSSLETERQALLESSKALEAQLAKTREYLSTSRARCGELQMQLRKKEDELSECQLDSRMAKREAKRLEESERLAREHRDHLQEEMSELQKQAEELRARVTQLELSLALAEKEATSTKLAHETERAKLEERIQMLRDSCVSTKDLEAKCVSKADECRELTVKCKVLQLEAQREAEVRTQVLNSSKELEEELKKEQAKSDKLLKTLEVLKETCEELDKQVVGYERELAEADRKNDEYKAQWAAHKETVDKLNKKIFELKESLLLAKTSKQRLEEQLQDRVQGEKEAEAALDSLQGHLREREALLRELSDQMADLRRQLGTYEASAKAWQRREAAYQQEMVAIKEEASHHITTIASLKASNLKLSRDLEEFENTHRETLQYLEKVESDMDGQKSFAETEIMKLNQTIAQQTKLINFLQAKVTEMEKKKKKLWGGRGKDGICCGTNLTQTSTLESSLSKYQSKCRQLQDALDRSHAESMRLRQQLNQTMAAAEARQSNPQASETAAVPTSPKSRALLTALTLSPSVSGAARTEVAKAQVSQEDVGDASGESSSALPPPSLRMQHNIPHRFHVVLCMRPTKCAACLDAIHFGRYASRCQECGAVCHPKCSTSVPSTCGVPAEYVRKFSDTMATERSLSTTPPSTPGPHVKFAPNVCEVTFDSSLPRGWVKVLRCSGGKQNWHKCFLVLYRRVLYLLDQVSEPIGPAGDNTNQTVEVEDRYGESLESVCQERIRMSPSDGEVLVSSAVPATELTGTAKSDIPYTFKVELKPHTTCWPPKCLYIMVPTFAEKQMWVSALEMSAGHNIDPSKCNAGDTVLRLGGDQVLDVNCVHELSYEYLLLGAMEGLYVVDLVARTVRRQVAAVPAVFQVAVCTQLGVVLAICGQERKLMLTNWTAMQPWVETLAGRDVAADPPEWRLVEDVKECHLFATSQDGTTLCMATGRAIYVHVWNASHANYTCRKEKRTSEPCSCILFTPYTILVGCDTFYEIDAKDFSFEDFLDPTDHSLSFLTYSATQLRSFPVSVLQVAPPEYNPEYLLCFHELGVFVNADGRRTRDDLKWSRLPLAFAYKSPHLFIQHLNSIEILEIKARGAKESGLHRIVLVSNPRFLGLSSVGSMYLASFHSGQLEIISVHATANSHSDQAQLPLSQDEGSEAAESDEMQFSFTSSVVEALDE